MAEIIPLRKFSFTRCEADETCRRKRYLSREWGGTGLQPILAGWSLVFGNIMHVALEGFAKSGQFDFQAVRKSVQTEAKKAGFDLIAQRDWAALAEGLLRGFEKCVWPNLMAEYEVIGTEKWIEYEAESGYLFRARQDLLLRNRFDKHIAYVDYKTTSSDRPQWIASWNKSVQLHSSMYAMRKALDINVERAIVIGLLKGYNDKKNHIQKSVFNYGYCNREYSMSPEYSYEYKRSKGWEMFSTAEEFDNLGTWVANMPTEILTAQFPQTGPIFARDDIAEKWFRQQLIREKEVDEGLKLLETSCSVDEITAVLDKYFRQNFSHCDPAYGYSCEFKNLCWIPGIEADPLGSGQFRRYEGDIEVE